MKPLGKKQSIDNSAWIEAMANIERLVAYDDIEKLSKETMEELGRATEGKKAAYGWSGGKDSIVLGHLCERAGITDSILAVCDLEYPAFMEWLNRNKPEGCEIINTGLNMGWLLKRLNILFPQNSAAAAPWFSNVQHKAQRMYFKKHNLDILLLGRRRADGNFVGRGANSYTDGHGVTRHSPLAAWKHESVLAYIHYHKLPLPPIYAWEKGYLCGTHPWPARQWTGSTENGWREVYGIDLDIVRGAAEHIESAHRFLEGVAS